MITVNGKQLIAKYLLGQAPAYATHLAVGVGAKSLVTGASASISPTIEALDFEAFRVPIIAKGLVREETESGYIEKIYFKAEMPTSERYLITEVGAYPAQSNLIAANYDSKLLITFSPTEEWSYYVNGSGSALGSPDTPLDSEASLGSIVTSQSATFVNSNSTIFENPNRTSRYESPRFLNTSLVVIGNSSTISNTEESPLKLAYSSSASYLSNNNISIDLSKNNLDDKIKLAFSLLSKAYDNDNNPDKVRIVIEFINELPNLLTNPPKGYLDIELSESDFNDSRYVIVEKTVGDIRKETNFSLSNINSIRIYTSVLNSEVPTSNYYILYDGLRLDNVTTINPLYSLVGYTVIKTDTGYPVEKLANSTNYIEYRFSIEA
jgi:hypothetical protein